MKLYPLVLLFFLATCASTPSKRDVTNFKYTRFGPVMLEDLPRKWAFDNDFPDDMKESVRRGFEMWDEALGFDIFVEVDRSEFSKRDTTLVRYKDHLHKENKERWAEARVYWNYGRITTVYVDFFQTVRKARPLTLTTIAMHEAGHSFGFKYHENDVSCLMYEFVENLGLKRPCEKEIGKIKKIYGK